MSSRTKYKRAFFDLDYTLLGHDTLFLFASFILRRKPWRIYYLFFFGPALFLYAIGLLSALGLKQAYSSILKGLSRDEVLQLSSDFAAALRHLLFSEIQAEIDALQNDKAELFLNSASPQFYIEAIAREFGFQHAIGTVFELPEKMPLFLKALGANNKRGVKLDQMRTIVAELEHFDSSARTEIPCLAGTAAYSDSSADLPLLELAEDKYVIWPGKKLEAIALKSGWTIWHPARPYSSRLGQAFLILRSMLGLYRI